MDFYHFWWADRQVRDIILLLENINKMNFELYGTFNTGHEPPVTFFRSAATATSGHGALVTVKVQLTHALFLTRQDVFKVHCRVKSGSALYVKQFNRGDNSNWQFGCPFPTVFQEATSNFSVQNVKYLLFFSDSRVVSKR